MIKNTAINPSTQDNIDVQMMKTRSEKIKTVFLRDAKNGIGGASKIAAGEVYIPSAKTARGRLVRYHEALHMEHTPVRDPKDLLDQALEDARLHLYKSKAATSLFEQARRDELTVALQDLRRIRNQSRRRRGLRAIDSLEALRAYAILKSAPIKPSHQRLLESALKNFGPDIIRNMDKALAALKDADGITTTKEWKKARHALSPYFAQDFDSSSPKAQSGFKASARQTGQDAQNSSREKSVSSGMSVNGGAPKEKSESSDTKSKGTGGSGTGEEQSEKEDKKDSNDNSSSSTNSEKPEEDSEETKEQEPEDEYEEEDELEEENIAPARSEHKEEKKKEEDEYEGDLTKDLLDMIKKMVEEQKQKRGYSDEGRIKYSEQNPLRVFIRRLDMSSNHVNIKLGQKRYSPAVTGKKIIYPRLANAAINPQARIFKRKIQAGNAGSILLDVSGSMNPTEEALHKFLSVAPALTLAFYNAPWDGVLWGNIFIYAANGYRAHHLDLNELEEKYTYGTGNVIDFQAMAWLLKQPAPRYLVTDKGFTGPWTTAARLACQKLEETGKITVVESMEEMQAILNKKAGIN